MCGIAGFYAPKFDNDKFPDVIAGMLGRISHRGPDQSGYFFDERAAIGAVRLSIIDLSTGTQPMSDGSGKFWISYNGEIYNFNELRKELVELGYQFRTQSDTEVVLIAYMAWGTKAFARFNGGFAVAIYDRVKKELVLARDRFGKRPLFYTNSGKTVLFSSELKGFIDVPEFNFEWNNETLASIFSLWTPLPTQTAFKGVQQLPLAGYLIANDQGVSVGTYSTYIPREKRFEGTEEEAVQQVRDLLEESVRLRLQSDVEVGVYLSGGIDSAIVARLAKDITKSSMRTFSIGFTDPDYDESPYQNEMSEFLGTRHTTLKISHEDIARDFPHSVMHAEMPLFRTAPVPLYALSSMVREHGIKVVLTGEGSDEAFLGYEIFKETNLISRWNQLEDSERDRILGKLYPYLAHYNADNFKGIKANYTRYCEPGESPFFGHSLRLNSSSFILRFLDKNTKPEQYLSSLASENNELFGSMSPVEQTQWIEFQTLLSGYLLSTQGDRMALSHGVENRCPFLDPDVLEFALSLPVDYRLKDGSIEKYILKKAFGQMLPQSITSRFKQPYLAPNAQVFFGANRPEYMESVLSEQELKKISVLDHDLASRFLKKLATSDASRMAPREHQAFMLIMSLALLDRGFIQKHESLVAGSALPNNLSVRVDGRSAQVDMTFVPAPVVSTPVVG